MTPVDNKMIDLKTRTNNLFAKIEEVRGFL
jgi:hypothetical protein